MKAFCDKMGTLHEYNFGGLEYEVLNELKDLSNRSDANCLYHTRFLFEDDTSDLQTQCKVAESLKNDLVRVVYSGSKSLHCIVEFDLKYESMCKEMYREIWQVLNDELFGGKCDSQCTNPSRLTRAGGVTRHNNGKTQTILLDKPGNLFSRASEVISKAKTIYLLHKTKSLVQATQMQNKAQSYTNQVDTSKWDIVKRYLETPFPKQNGNGVSNIWLYAALQTTKKYNDLQTQLKVIAKAKSEGWTDKEIEHKLKGK